MVVGDNVHLFGLFSDLADSLGDFEKLKFVIEIIIPGILPRTLAEPVLGISPVQTEIAGFAGDILGGADGIGDLGLVDIAKADMVFPQKLVYRTSIPGSMADLQDQGVLFTFPYELF